MIWVYTYKKESYEAVKTYEKTIIKKGKMKVRIHLN
jgi:hypothetical protein